MSLSAKERRALELLASDLHGTTEDFLVHAHGETIKAGGKTIKVERYRITDDGGFDDIGAVDDEIRGIVARNWPHLLSKLPPEED